MAKLEVKDIISFVEQTGIYSGKTTLSDKNIIGDINLNNLNLNESLIFYKCEFESKVAFENLKLRNNIVFSNCIFRDGLSFSNVEKIDLGNKNQVVIEISRGKIRDVSFNHVNIDGIYIKDFSETDLINIVESSVKSIELNDIQRLNSFHIYNIIVSGELLITRCKLFHNFNCRESEVNVFSLNNCEFNLPILFFCTFLTVEFNIYECDFKDYVSIHSPTNDVDVNGKIEIVSSRFNKDLSYYFEEEKDKFFNHKMFSFAHNIISDGFRMNYLGGVIKGGIKRDFVLKDLNLVFSNKSEGFYSFSHLIFENIIVNGNNVKSSIEFSNVSCKNISFEKFINLGNVLMINCFENININYERFKIADSLFNNLTLMNVNLNKFRQVHIIGSSLNSIKANNTIFFDFNKLGGKGDCKKRSFLIRMIRSIIPLLVRSRNSQEIDFWENKREVYKQLKQSMEQNGDRIHALDFKSYEMKAYRQYLMLTKYIFNSNRIILGLSSTNDFGLNWLKALLLCTLTMGLFYMALLVQTSPILGFHYNVSYFKVTLDEMVENSGIYFQLLNPIHDVKKVFESANITGLTYFIDYLSRIVMSFFIFQIVSAFRKYIK